MKMLIDSQEIAKALQSLKPRRIAVAYVGKDWEQFLPIDSLEEVIVAPTVGSKPKAIRQIARRMGGWDNVYLLDNLHAKVFIGEKAAIVGSANLSNNALGMTGLEEVGVRVDEAPALEALRARFEELKALAFRRYPTAAAKLQRLLKAEEDRKKSIFRLERDDIDAQRANTVDEARESEIEAEEAEAKERESVLQVIRKQLVGRLKRFSTPEEALISYKALAKRVNGRMGYDILATGGKRLGQQLGELLGELNEREHKKGRPILSGLVIVAKDGRPSIGYFESKQYLGLFRPDTDQWQQWGEDLQEAWRYYHSSINSKRLRG